MANHRANNVIFVDTDAAFEGPLYIKQIRYVAGSTGQSVTIKKKDSSGAILWSSDASTDFTDEVCIVALQGIYVDVAGTTPSSCYIHLK